MCCLSKDYASCQLMFLIMLFHLHPQCISLHQILLFFMLVVLQNNVELAGHPTLQNFNFLYRLASRLSIKHNVYIFKSTLIAFTYLDAVDIHFMSL